jgi:hypothetical protein
MRRLFSHKKAQNAQNGFKEISFVPYAPFRGSI